MRRRELEQYPDIIEEIESLEHAAFDAGSAARLEELRRWRAAAERYVRSLPNARIRRVVTLRALEGRSWRDVAAHMGHRYSEESVRMIYRRAVKR